mgnify:CR=1 FL=1
MISRIAPAWSAPSDPTRYAACIELAGKARVQGNLHYKVVEMSAGAQLTGRLVHADAVPAAGHEGAVQPEAWAAADA